MTRPKPKTVRAWAFARTYGESAPFVTVFSARRYARIARRAMIHSGGRVGPVVRIEVPAPKERKR